METISNGPNETNRAVWKTALCDSCNECLTVEVTDPHLDIYQACPTGIRKEELQESLCKMEKEREAYHAQIQRLNHLLKSLTGDRDALDNVIQRHRHVLAPVRKLPPDLLLEIFRIVVEEDKAQSAESDRKESKRIMLCRAPILLSHVCSSWRTVALSVTSLWADLDLTDSLPYEAHEEGKRPFQHPLLSLCLKRSGNQPLHINLSGSNWANSAMKALVGQSRRWRSLKMAFPDEASDIPGVLAWILRYQLPILERLHVHYDFPEDDSEIVVLPDFPVTLFQLAPKLHYFHLSSLPIDLVPLSWHQLKTLRVTSIWLEDLHQLLRLCLNLETAIFQRCIWLTSRASQSPEDMVPYTTNISTLAIETSQSSHIHSNVRALEPMIAPYLKHVYLTFDREWEKEGPTEHINDLFPSVLRMIKRSGCSLLTFKCQYIHIQSTDLTDLCSSCPHVESLALRFLGSNKLTIPVLSKIKEENLLPSVRILEVQTTRVRIPDNLVGNALYQDGLPPGNLERRRERLNHWSSSFLSFVDERTDKQSTSTRLEKVVVEYPDSNVLLDHGQLEKIEDLRRRGVEIYVIPSYLLPRKDDFIREDVW